jgi:hypothetical protein
MHDHSWSIIAHPATALGEKICVACFSSFITISGLNIAIDQASFHLTGHLQMEMEATCCSNTSVNFPRITRRYVLEDTTLYTAPCFWKGDSRLPKYIVNYGLLPTISPRTRPRTYIYSVALWLGVKFLTSYSTTALRTGDVIAEDVTRYGDELIVSESH